MPAERPSRRNRVLIVAVVIGVVAGFGIRMFLGRQDAQLHALFEGTYEDRADQVEEDARREKFYTRVAYEDAAYTLPDRAPGEAKPTRKPPTDVAPTTLLESSKQDEGWERDKPAIHGEWHVDVKTGATKVARMRSQTAHRERYVPRFLTVTHPTDNAVFPPNLCTPFVTWEDVHNSLWEITLTREGETGPFSRALSETRRWRIPDDVWSSLTSDPDRTVTLRVKGIDYLGFGRRGRDTVHRSRLIRFRVSADEADAAIIYRLVAPPFYNRKTPNMFVRDIRQRGDRLFLNARREYCFNCHTFSSKQGDRGKLAVQVRYSGKRELDHLVWFSVFDIDAQRGRKTILPFKVQMTTWMSWSPDGTKLAFSGNQQITAYGPITLETQSVGQPTSDLGVYDTTTETVALLPGASADNTLEIYPRWTPTGDALVFSSAEGGRHPILTQFTLMHVPYNAGRGGVATCIVPSTQEHPSNYFARFSPDGKWMSFVSADYGSLIKASSDLWIMAVDASGKPTGTPRKLACNAAYAADSWHSWSSNSRWIVFASKRDDGVFARLYLTHIDATGHASPAVRLPIDDDTIRVSFNIPEFVKRVPPIVEQALFEGVGAEAEAFNVKPRRPDADDRQTE